MRICDSGCSDADAETDRRASTPRRRVAASPLVELLSGELNSQGFVVSIEDVDYEFQRGGNQMMRICRAS
jgi:hypothetical protein